MIQEEEERKVEERLIRHLDKNHKNHEETEKTIVGLKGQMEESNKVEEYLTSQLQENKEIC